LATDLRPNTAAEAVEGGFNQKLVDFRQGTAGAKPCALCAGAI
jgi:hypothetical protein